MRSSLPLIAVLAFGVGCQNVRQADPVDASAATDATTPPRLDATAGQDAAPAPVDAGTMDAVVAADSGSEATDGAQPDATTADDAATDAGVASDAATNQPDATPNVPDAGPGNPTCNDHTFTHQDANATSVWVTGSFTNWGATLADGAIALTQNGNTWSATVNVPTGRHIYKFIVNGNQWIQDPGNPDGEPDGFGGFNSVLNICAEGTFEVLSHQTNGQSFTAQLRYDGSSSMGSAAATLDHTPVAAGVLTTSGSMIDVSLTGLSDGIHDLRVMVGTDRIMLKIYVNETTDWRDTTMYFAMTDRFRNGDSNNDAPIGGLHALTDYLGGDFAGITQAINANYFDDLGINSIWISWPVDNTDTAWSGLYKTANGCNVTGDASTMFSGYHGYWPSSGRNVESKFGTMQELRDMVNAAHTKGIRILLDFTANHVHSDSSYFSQNPNTWFNQPAILCRAGHWDDHLKEECWFDSFLPDWNHSNAGARKQVIDDAIWLAVETGADGFRVDALKHMEDQFIRELRTRTETEFEQTGIDFYLVGETFTGDLGAINYYVNSEMMHGQFDFPSNMAIRQGLGNDQIGVVDMHNWVRSNKATYGSDSPLMSTFAGNHDISRFISKASGDLPCGIWSVGPDQSRAFDGPPPQPTADWPYLKLQLAMVYTYTVPGVPLLYYGDEVGLAGAGDPDNRRMLPDDNQLSNHMQSTKAFMQTLGQLRASTPVLRTGDWTGALFGDATGVAFARTSAQQNAVIIINRNDARTITVDVSSLNLSQGSTLDRRLGSGTVTVQNGQISVDMPRLGAEILLTR